MKRNREEQSPTISSQSEPSTASQHHHSRCPREFFSSLSHPIPDNVGMQLAHSRAFLRTLTGEVPPLPEYPSIPPNHSIPPEVLSEYRRASTPMHLPYYPPPPPPIPIPYLAVSPFTNTNGVEIKENNKEEQIEEKEENNDDKDKIDWSSKRIWPVMGFGVMDIREKTDSYIIALDLPGVSKEDIDVSLKPGNVVVECVRKDFEGKDGVKGYLERPFGKLIRTMQLPLKADPKTISCKYENGVLYITIHKLEDWERIKKVRVD